MGQAGPFPKKRRKKIKSWGYESAEDYLEDYPNYGYFIRQIIPWLQEAAPHSVIEVNNNIINNYESDPLRWGAIFERALSGANPREAMPKGSDYWVVGTRNATEEELGAWSNISKGVSVQPLKDLWKSEVLRLCEDLGVPSIALEKSCEADCNCGRDALIAQHITEVDWILMAQKGELSPLYVQSYIEKNLLEKLEAVIEKIKKEHEYKKRTPYSPDNEIVREWFL